MQNVPESTVIVGLMVLMALTQIINHNFLSFANITTMLKSIPFIALTGLGLSLTLIVGEVDISVGRMAGLCGMVFGWMLMYEHWPLPLAMLAGIVTGLICGTINAFLTVIVGVNSFVVTMGMLYIVGGIRYIINTGNAITLPDSYRSFSGQTPGGISWFFWIVVGIFILIGFLESRTKFGRRMYAVGSNKEVAKLQGVNVTFIKMSAFILAGLFSGLAGVMAAIDLNSAQAPTGTGWEFRCVAACCIGGVTLGGGRGRAFGVAVGTFVVFVINNIINMMAISNYYSDVFTGCILAGAVLIDVLEKSKKIKAEA